MLTSFMAKAPDNRRRHNENVWQHHTTICLRKTVCAKKSHAQYTPYLQNKRHARGMTSKTKPKQSRITPNGAYAATTFYKKSKN